VKFSTGFFPTGVLATGVPRTILSKVPSMAAVSAILCWAGVDLGNAVCLHAISLQVEGDCFDVGDDVEGSSVGSSGSAMDSRSLLWVNAESNVGDVTDDVEDDVGEVNGVLNHGIGGGGVNEEAIRAIVAGGWRKVEIRSGVFNHGIGGGFVKENRVEVEVD
jgi:hypothetical protein